VNRYKSLVVRRRLVESWAPRLQPGQGWDKLFESAGSQKQTDLTPYWHVPRGSTQLRRIVPLLPLSKESFQYSQMLKILSLYRLAFGQPGQQELLEYLSGLNLSKGELAELK